jgi:hypothetical protein
VDRSDLLLTLERAGGLAGRVLDAETGEPVDVFRVRIVQAKLRSGDEQPARWPGYRARWSDDGMLFSGTGGRWNTATENLAPGWILGIEISAPGSQIWVDDHVVVALDSSKNPIVARLVRSAALAGRVVLDGSGHPVVGATVSVFAGLDALRTANSEDRQAARLTDADGRFRFDQVPGGEVVLLVKPREGPVVIDGPFHVQGRAYERIVRLHGGGKIEGLVTDPSGLPIGNVVVELQPSNVPGQGPGLMRRTQSSASGSFSFAGLASGDYWLARVVEREGITVRLVNHCVSVEAPTTKRVELHQQRGTASLRIERRETPGLAPLFGVNLVHVQSQRTDSKVPWEEREPMRGGFVEDGKPLVLEGLAPGEYMLIKVPFGRPQKVVLTAGTLTSVTIPAQ